MSDVPSGASSTGAGYDLPPTGPGYAAPPAEPATYRTGAVETGDSTGGTEKAKQVAQQGAGAASQAASEVSSTAKDQAQRVAAEAKTQAKDLAGSVRDRMSEQARSQNDRLVSGIREAAGHLDDMRGDRPDSPATAVVSRVAEGGRQFADYLDRNGPEGVLREVQDFARRRPGAFLLTAFAAGFLATRVGKGIAQAGSSGDQGKPSGDAYSPTPAPVADTGYATTGYATGTGTGYADTGYADTGYTTTGTEYAGTGTGTPRVVADDLGDVRPSSYPGEPR